MSSAVNNIVDYVISGENSNGVNPPQPGIPRSTSTMIINEISQSKLSKTNNKNKRDCSTLSDSGNKHDKKHRLGIDINNSNEVSKLLNIIFDRLDAVEDEVNELNGKLLLLTEKNKVLIKENQSQTDKISSIQVNYDKLRESHVILQSKVHDLDMKCNPNNNIEMSEDVVVQSGDHANTHIQANKRFADLFTVNDKKQVSKPMADIINVINEYTENKKDRDNNLIIFGLNVDGIDDHNAKVKNLMMRIGVKKFSYKNSIRLVKKGQCNPVAPIKITLHNEAMKYEILKAAKNLKDINQKFNSKISIGLDLTEIDRQANKLLLLEKKQRNDELKRTNVNDHYYGIRGNKVVKIMKPVTA